MKLVALFLVILFASSQASDATTGSTTSSVLHDVSERLRHVLTGRHTFIGKIRPILEKAFYIDKIERAAIYGALKETVQLEDLVILSVTGWMLAPAIKLPYTQLPAAVRYALSSYYEFIRVVAVHLQHVAQIALLVYCVDIIKIVLVGMGFHTFAMDNFPYAFAQIAYLLWSANRLAVLKKFYIRQFISEHPDTFGRMKIVNRLADAAIGAATLTVIMGILKVKMGIALSSVLALGSAGTLAIGLASQGVAKSVLNGLLLASSDHIYEGDYVRFGKGKAEGTIVKLGWLETVLRGSDDILVNIPNTDLVSTPISNLSRVRFSQVKQVLRFSLKDRAILPKALQTIKDQVELECPELVTDGSRPFRASLTNYGPGFVEATVDFHFRIRPVGDQYWENRQRVLCAIDTALRKHEIELK